MAIKYRKVNPHVKKFKSGGGFAGINPAENKYSDADLFGTAKGSAFGQQASRDAMFSQNTSAFKAPTTFKQTTYNVNPTPPSLVPRPTKSYTEELNPTTSPLTKPSVLETAASVAPSLVPAVKSAITPAATSAADGTAKAAGTVGDAATKPGAFSSGGAGMGTAAAIGGAVGSALPSLTDDGDEMKVTKKESTGTIAGSTLQYAAMGASVGGVWGAAVGAVVGAVVGVFANKKAKKRARKLKAANDIRLSSVNDENVRRTVAQRDAAVASSTPSTTSMSSAGENPQGYAVQRRGGTFHFELKQNVTELRAKREARQAARPTQILKKGGKIKPTENIIPNGVLHEEDNALGDKGMPVVKCVKNTCEKKYEIEKEELIFTLDTTKNVETLAKSSDLKKLGEYVKDQLLDNTHSFTDKFGDLNNRN